MAIRNDSCGCFNLSSIFFLLKQKLPILKINRLVREGCREAASSLGFYLSSRLASEAIPFLLEGSTH
jgi:hypothetical protein